MRGQYIALVLMAIVVLGLGQKQASSLLSKLFGQGNAANKFQLQRDDNDDGLANSQNIAEQAEQKAIPYEMILPRRRTSRANDLLSRVLEMMILDNILRGKQRKPAEQVFSWTNPLFKQEDDMSISRVMGKRGKAGRAKVRESDVQELLVKAMPALKDGEILKMEPLSFKKGIMLSIDYKTVGNQLQSIKARYRPHRKQLDIISLVQNLNPFSALSEDEDSGSESEESQSQTASNIGKAMERIQKIMKESKQGQKKQISSHKKDEGIKKEEKRENKVQKKEEKKEVKKQDNREEKKDDVKEETKEERKEEQKKEEQKKEEGKKEQNKEEKNEEKKEYKLQPKLDKLDSTSTQKQPKTTEKAEVVVVSEAKGKPAENIQSQ